MNYWTQLSVDLANQRDYLDQLFRVYPLAPEIVRELDEANWQRIEEAFNTKDNQALVANLLRLKLFPIKDSYVPYLRKDKSAIARNPQTINRLAGRLYEMGLDKIWARASEPKETNRQMGPLFCNWIMNGALGVPILEESDFLSTSDNAVLLGSDAALKDFATRHLNYRRTKRPDLVAKFNGKYVVGEAKFLTDQGGHQTGQFDDAMSLVNTAGMHAVTVAILDGVVYIPGKTNWYKAITTIDANVVSSLLLRDFLYQV